MSKKKISQRVYEYLFPQSKPAPRRSYAAARVDRTNMNWTTMPTSANYSQRISLATLRARARDASRNDPHLSKFLSLSRSNIIGPKGIQLQARARRANGKLNVTLNKRVEEAWWQWCHAETCTMSGKLDFKQVQDLCVTQLECDGEFLIQLMPMADNAFGFSLKVWDVNWLDETFNEMLPNGNRVIMSVEVDRHYRPIAYWLTQPPVETYYAMDARRDRVRIPAAEMIHGFTVFDDESQIRGVSAFASVLLTAKDYAGYKRGVITSARVAANSFGFVKQQLPDGEEWTGGEDENGEVQLPMIDSSPLSINLLNPGMEFQQFDPQQPTQNHAAFSKTILMELAAGLGVPYFYLAGDMESVNFSSARVGLDDAREIWKGMQNFIANTLCRRVFNEWLMNAWAKGALTITAQEYREIRDPEWRARGWKYIDPTKDIAADIERLKYRLATPSEILGEQGIDYVDHLERWQADVELAAGYGVDLEEIYADPKQIAADEPPAKTDTNATRGYLNGHDMDADILY